MSSIMPSKHCPLCNTNKVFAVGAVNYSDGVLVEHRCAHCGHMFYLRDLRNVAPLNSNEPDKLTFIQH